jgi:hypothetical protein
LTVGEDITTKTRAEERRGCSRCFVLLGLDPGPLRVKREDSKIVLKSRGSNLDLHTLSHTLTFCHLEVKTAHLGTWADRSMTVLEEEIYICSSRLGLIKMDHRHSGNGRNSQQ